MAIDKNRYCDCMKYGDCTKYCICWCHKEKENKMPKNKPSKPVKK